MDEELIELAKWCRDCQALPFAEKMAIVGEISCEVRKQIAGDKYDRWLSLAALSFRWGAYWPAWAALPADERPRTLEECEARLQRTYAPRLAKQKRRNRDGLFELMDLPPTHLTDDELDLCDAYIRDAAAAIRSQWTPEREAEARGVTGWSVVTSIRDRPVLLADGRWVGGCEVADVSTADLDFTGDNGSLD